MCAMALQVGGMLLGKLSASFEFSIIRLVFLLVLGETLCLLVCWREAILVVSPYVLC